MGKRTLHLIGLAFYPALLLVGAAFATSGIVVGVQRYNQAVSESGSDLFRGNGWYVISHAGTGIVLLLLTLIYALVHWRRGSRAVAPLIYLSSYCVCGLLFEVVLASAGKGETVREDLWTLAGGTLFLMPALLVATGGLIWTARPKLKL